MPAEAAQSILVQAILDPYYNQVHLQSLQTKWLSLYYEVQDLQAKKKAAEEICSKIVSRRLILGLVPIAANIAFIWSGTYIFYSWDIIEPIAYFISSMAGIVLVSSFRKLQKPYSNANFR